VGLLWLAYFLNQADRQIFGVALPLIRDEFQLSDTQMGLIATAFSVIFGLFVPVAGWLGDRFPRRIVVVCSLLTFSFGTLLTGLASAFLPLLLFRGVATGVGEALYAPAANTLVAEHHVDTRGRALALHQTANYTGVVVGSFLAGAIADRFGWRSAFAVFGCVGLVWALVIWLRTHTKSAARTAQPPVQKFLLAEALAKIVGTPELIAQLFGFSGLVFVLVGYLTWMPSLLVERFHLSLAQAGFQAVAGHHLLAYLGLLATGVATDRMISRWPRMRLVSMGVALVWFAPFLFLCAVTKTEPVLYLALAAFGLCRGIYDAGLYAAIFDHVENRLRASVAGLIVAVSYVVASLSPLIIGMLRARYGLEAGMEVLAGGALAAGLIFLAIIFGHRRALAA
jgi:MFS family permease